MALNFEKHTGETQDFFAILPLDWQEAVKVVWLNPELEAEIFVVRENQEIIAGGIVFKSPTADMDCFKKDARTFLNAASFYIGYLWVIESRRGEDLGSLWLDAVKKHFPKNNFWLTIEDEYLGKFYVKNNFTLIGECHTKACDEWLYFFNRDD